MNLFPSGARVSVDAGGIEVLSTASVSNYVAAAFCALVLGTVACGAAAPVADQRGTPVGPVGGVSAAAGMTGAMAPTVSAGHTVSSTGLGDFGSPQGVLPPPTAGVGDSGGCRPATIAFVIDGSGSMCETFGNSTRWRELRAALLQKGAGLMYKINSLATFGLYLYDAPIDLALAGMATGSAATNPQCAAISAIRRSTGACPQILEVKPAMNNAARIDAMYPQAELGGSTPTDKAMNYVVDQMVAIRTPGQDLKANPQFIILATDGQPNDICMGGLGGDGTVQQQGVIAAVDKASSLGITTYVISLAMDAALQAHLDEVARHGNVMDPAARTFTPIDSNDLIMTLSKILGTAVGCLF